MHVIFYNSALIHYIALSFCTWCSKNLLFSQRGAYTTVLRDSRKSIKHVVSHVRKQKWRRHEYRYLIYKSAM